MKVLITKHKQHNVETIVMKLARKKHKQKFLIIKHKQHNVKTIVIKLARNKT